MCTYLQKYGYIPLELSAKLWTPRHVHLVNLVLPTTVVGLSHTLIVYLCVQQDGREAARRMSPSAALRLVVHVLLNHGTCTVKKSKNAICDEMGLSPETCHCVNETAFTAATLY